MKLVIRKPGLMQQNIEYKLRNYVHNLSLQNQLHHDINQERPQIEFMQQTSQTILDQPNHDVAAIKDEQVKLWQDLELKNMADKFQNVASQINHLRNNNQKLKNALEKAQNDLSVANDKAYQYKIERDAARAKAQNLQDQLHVLQQMLDAQVETRTSPRNVRMNYKQFSGSSDTLDQFYDCLTADDTNHVIVNGKVYDVLPPKVTQSPSKTFINDKKGDICGDLLPTDSRVGNADYATVKIKNRKSKQKVAQGDTMQDTPKENPTLGISGQGNMDEFGVLGGVINNMGASEDKGSLDEDKKNLLSREYDIDEGIVFKVVMSV